MFIPRPPRPKFPKGAGKSIQRAPVGGLLHDGVTAFEKPATEGDKQNQAAFKPLPGA